ncbi:hypothetical protein, partial [Streptomyces europaeiscabiei]|uniref:hypothetical protein n=1 Tax=Streptomyces europaeiscabiei TaxID=146819 RepID=UPI0029B67D9A
GMWGGAFELAGWGFGALSRTGRTRLVARFPYPRRGAAGAPRCQGDRPTSCGRIVALAVTDRAGHGHQQGEGRDPNHRDRHPQQLLAAVRGGADAVRHADRDAVRLLPADPLGDQVPGIRRLSR